MEINNDSETYFLANFYEADAIYKFTLVDSKNKT